MDDNNWIIGNNGTNGSDWAEIIDGTGETYRTLGKWIISLDWRITEFIELMEPLELVEWLEEMTGSDGLVGIDGTY